MIKELAGKLISITSKENRISYILQRWDKKFEVYRWSIHKNGNQLEACSVSSKKICMKLAENWVERAYPC